MTVVSRTTAACLALAAFTVSVLAGLFGGSDATAVLGRALMAMIICYPIGLIVGLICERIISDHVREHEQANPVPEDTPRVPPPGSAPATAPANEDEEEVITV